MNIPELGITSEHLVVETKKLMGLKGILWYSTPEGEHFLNATNRNQLSFTWEARYEDGSTLRQYEDIMFLRALKDDQFVPPVDQLTSTAALNKKQVVEYILYPIAFTRKMCPWYQTPFRFVIRPKKNERLVARWETDFRPRDKWLIRRHVAGIAIVDADENVISETLLVLSPTGTAVISGTTDVSFDGE